MSIQDLRKLIHPVCDTAIRAGNLIIQYYKSQNEILLKKDNSPLTQADLESNKLIKNSLFKLNNDIPIFTEESLVDWSVRREWQTYWLVDPLDGTKEFINANDEFTVNIALIENNQPILGVIYAPALKLLYFAFKNGGSYRLDINNEQKIDNFFSKAVKLQTSFTNKNNFLTIICSRSHPNNEFEYWLKQNVKKYELIKKGSSLKFCNIAEGAADIYPRFRPTSEWDIAAGHIIVLEAGGKLETIDNKEVLYNLKESVINPYFIVSCKLEL